jgi:hypothetical protein
MLPYNLSHNICDVVPALEVLPDQCELSVTK